MRAPLRHSAVMLGGGALLWLFVAIRPEDLHQVHKWNRAWADVAVVLLAFVFLIGPLARIWPAAARALEWRRELGVWALVAGVVHVGYYAAEAFDWNLARFVQESEHHGADGSPVGFLTWRKDAWAAGNWVGIIALGYGLMPLLTSNNLSQRILGTAWKRLQDHGHIFYVLVMVHFLLFWLLVYHPEQMGPAVPLFWAIVALVAGFETTALVAMVRKQRMIRKGH